MFRYEHGELHPDSGSVVAEFPLRLRVNGRELATLIASPHRLDLLVVGFLRLQGFIRDRDDLLSLGICADFGLAEVRIRGSLPERLRPILTSGCGTGIVFDLPGTVPPACATAPRTFAPAAIFRLFAELARRAEAYRSHGGIHSAAVGDGDGNLLFWAEDLGRHNTLDRIAGEALLQGVDLRGLLLVTSGRISSEMAAKAAQLGIACLASRTSATDQAQRFCVERGLGLLGYVRGESFTVYAQPQLLQLAAPQAGRLSGITGVILAGGASRRMGSDKSLLPLQGGRFIDHAYRCLAGLFDEVLIVTNTPELYADLPCRKVADLHPQRGSLTGIHAALRQARHERVFVVACDMPFLAPEAIRQVCAAGGESAVTIPRSSGGLEPLHALYARACLPAIEAALAAGEQRIAAFFPAVGVREVALAATAGATDERSFVNINTPQEYFALRETPRAADVEPDLAARTAP